MFLKFETQEEFEEFSKKTFHILFNLVIAEDRWMNQGGGAARDIKHSWYRKAQEHIYGNVKRIPAPQEHFEIKIEK